MRKPWLLAMAAAAGLALAGAAKAQCVTIDNASVPGSYNPFSPTGFDQTLTLTVRRGLISTVREANVVFVRRPGDNRDYDVKIVSDDGGSIAGTSVLYYPPGPILSTANNNPGEIEADFLILPTRTFQARFTAPPQSDIQAGNVQLVFDVKFLCESLLSNDSGTTSSGFTLNLTVLSALQASFVGSSLDFKEIGSITTAGLPSVPDTVKRVTSALRVASSGPYEIKATSQNGWAMTPNGGSATLPRQKISYELSLAGRVARPGNEFTPKVCARATVTGTYLPMSVTLLEGGANKEPSPTYQDTITVTVTPLGATTPAPDNCT